MTNSNVRAVRHSSGKRGKRSHARCVAVPGRWRSHRTRPRAANSAADRKPSPGIPSPSARGGRRWCACLEGPYWPCSLANRLYRGLVGRRAAFRPEARSYRRRAPRVPEGKSCCLGLTQCSCLFTSSLDSLAVVRQRSSSGYSLHLPLRTPLCSSTSLARSRLIMTFSSASMNRPSCSRVAAFVVRPAMI